jgi:hypothetical protein
MNLGSANTRPVIVSPAKNRTYGTNSLRSEWIVGARGAKAYAVHRIWLASIVMRNGKVTTDKLLMDELTSTAGMNNKARIQANLPTVAFDKKYRFAVATCDNDDPNGTGASCVKTKWVMSDFSISAIQPAPAAPQLTVQAGATPSSAVSVVYRSADLPSHERTTHFEEYAALKRNGKVEMMYTTRQTNADIWFPQTLKDQEAAFANFSVTKTFAGDTHQRQGDTILVSIRACSDGVTSATPYLSPRSCSAWTSQSVTVSSARALVIRVSAGDFGKVLYGDDAGTIRGECTQPRCDVALPANFRSALTLTFEPHSKWEWNNGVSNEVPGKLISVNGCSTTTAAITANYNQTTCVIQTSTNSFAQIYANFGPK